MLDVCVVGASHERPGSHVAETHGEAGVAEFIEIGRRVEPDERVMILRWPQVLPDGQEVAIGAPQVAHGFQNLIAGLAQPDHHARLDRHRRVDLLDPAQQLQRKVVITLGADLWEDASHSLDIVVEDLGPGVDNRGESVADRRKNRV